VRSDDPTLFPPGEYPDKLVDSTSASDSPDLELFSTPFAYKVCFFPCAFGWACANSQLFLGTRPNRFRRTHVRVACVFTETHKLWRGSFEIREPVGATQRQPQVSNAWFYFILFSLMLDADTI